ncbi:MAG: P-II family nitrogen regulator [Clostridiales bacterium]|jgi:nitrogen regulatory protein PII|nr:P-II family nitrogen regulator [Clostridiales bacterium]
MRTVRKVGFELLVCVVNAEQGSKTLQIAKHHGVRGGTICMARGTMSNKMLEFLELNDSRKEVVMMVAEREIIIDAMQTIAHEMHFTKAHHGIGITIPLSHFLGTKHYNYDDGGAPEMGTMEAIFTVVDRGLAEDVIEAAKSAGARGGTIINARGSGIHEDSVIFAMPIEPEKEIVLIIANNSITKAITDSIRAALHIDKPNHGIIFIAPVNETIGLR